MDARLVVESIRNEVESARSTSLWGSYINALNLISQVVFTRSSGFILEFIQNAEDAGLGTPVPGVFTVRLNKSEVRIQHNGAPFSHENVVAISRIGSSKKPESGTLGYLGIGFKSVFKVTDCPRVYSGDFRFKFDRAAWPDPADTPWHVIPLWIEDAETPFEAALTTFAIPLRDEQLYPGLQEELKSIRTELFLFLKWLKKIEITDEPSGEVRTIENLGEDSSGITTLSWNGLKQRFKFFRRTVGVPDWVKQDRLTQQYRANVTQREISIAFALDSTGNLAPSRAGAMYGGVYSFIPLGEATSGAKFPIQADFLVQPGRDAINYEAPWNHWLMGEVADLCKEAIEHFKAHPLWKFQFLTAFDFKRNVGQESYEKLFGPKLVEPVEQSLNTDACVPTHDGGWTYLNHAVRLAEDTKTRDELVKLGILSMDEVANVLGAGGGLVLIDSRVMEGDSHQITAVDRRDLLRNEEFLRLKAGDPNGAEWFRALYRWLAENPVRNVTQSYREYRVSDQEFKARWLREDGRTYRVTPESYSAYEFVLAADKQLHRGGLVHIPELRSTDPLFEELANSLQKARPILHPSILGAARNEQERTIIRGLLTGRAGVQTLDAKRVCQEAILPKIVTDAPKPASQDLLRLTNLCLQHLPPEELPANTELWVLVKRAGPRPAREVVFGTDYLSGQDWESNRHYVSGVTFLSQRYLPKTPSNETTTKLRNFFKHAGVQDAPRNGVEEFGVNFTIAQLKASGVRVTKKVEKRNYGYDLLARLRTGGMMRIEVKGQSHDEDVELTGNEASSADKHKNEYYLAVVPGVPNNPALYVLNNPAVVGKKDKLRVEINSWKNHKWT
jgi:hypothetical protein